MKLRYLLLSLTLLFAMPVFAAHSVTFSWTAPATGPAPDHYSVYRSTTTGTGYVLLATVPATQLSFTNGSNPNGTPLVEGTTYFYVVTSVVGGVQSANSNEVKGPIPVTTTTPQPPVVAAPKVQ